MKQHPSQRVYARTFNCNPLGGDMITLHGTGFGAPDSPPSVKIDGKEVNIEVWSPDLVVSTVQFLAPPSEFHRASLEVQNSRLTGLNFQTYLAYQVTPPIPKPPLLSNIVASTIDLTWKTQEKQFTK